MADTPTERPISTIRKVCSSIDVWLQNASYGIVNHILWKSLIVFFTIVLLLGRPFQFWLIPARGDVFLNCLHLIGFGVFCLDMVFHCYLDALYYPWIDVFYASKRRRSSLTPQQQRLLWRYLPCIYPGSFDFWCDLLSTICFLLEVEFIFASRFDVSTIEITLNEYGFPDPIIFAEEIETETVFSTFSVLLLIFKTLRVARLVPPMQVVDLSTKINLQWYFARMRPSFYWQKFQRRRRKKKEQKAKKNMSTDGGGLLVATMAARRMMKEREKQIKERGRLVYAMYLLKKWSLNVLRFFRILPNKNSELNRQIAATRIQRAWRNRMLFGNADTRSEEGEGSQAWTRDGLSSSLDFTPFSRRSRVDGRESGSNPRDSGSNPRHSKEPIGQSNATNTIGQKLKRRRQKKKPPSQVGSAMAELTGQTVTLFLFANLLIALGLTYIEYDTTDASTMVILHGQTRGGNMQFAQRAVDVATLSAVPNLYSYNTTSSEKDFNFSWSNEFYNTERLDRLRKYEIRSITVSDEDGKIKSTGFFDIKSQVDQRAVTELFLLVFVLLAWFFGVAAFAAPIMALVIVPIERAVKLLGMLVNDPLGYQSTLQYKNFLTEADQIAKSNGRWTREVLKGMETEFLMSTIVRIGSLMKVGFGSAGVQIIRNNLQKNAEDTGKLLLNSQGTMVSCIFLFCDIRSFTDVTECLQEEVFSFTNQIAAVVHSICNSYGGAANKNIGDAFLISWKLDENFRDPRQSFRGIATSYQADKALFSVVKICMALHHNEHYVEMLSEHAKEKLLNKLKDRPGPTVQIGFGLHAGKAVEGAIGSQRKMDATYVSMAVETAEYLESSTKKYKVPMLLSDSFHRLLQPRRRQRCRKIDRVMFESDTDECCEKTGEKKPGKMMDLFTYDVDIDALWNETDSLDGNDDDSEGSELISSMRMNQNSDMVGVSQSSPRETLVSSLSTRGSTITDSIVSRGGDITAAIAAAAAKALGAGGPTVIGEPIREDHWKEETSELVLPTGRAFYSENIWRQPEIRRIRRRYTTNMFDMFNLGLQEYYSKEWDGAAIHFQGVLDMFEDGPSQYFLDEMKKHNWQPPEGFQPYGKA